MLSKQFLVSRVVSCTFKPSFISKLQSQPNKIQGAQKRRRYLKVSNQAPSDVFVLDFDGVLVDSEPEIRSSGFQFAKKIWAQVFDNLDDSKQELIQNQLTMLRPVLVNGYEIVVMARMLAEDGNCVEDILANWPQQMESQFSCWGVDGNQVKKEFEEYRVGLQKEERDSWLALNTAYPGVKEGLMYCEFPFYIVSSKSAGRVADLLQNSLGIKGIGVDSARLLADLLPPDTQKPKALKQINDRPICKESGARLHFIDDRLDTLLAIRKDPELQNWRLYLAEWGYLSKKDKETVKQGLPKGITPLTLNNFLELLKWGILMGVDDGCEPTTEEVVEGVTAGLQNKK